MVTSGKRTAEHHSEETDTDTTHQLYSDFTSFSDTHLGERCVCIFSSVNLEHELGRTPGDGKGQGGLACCSPWGLKGSDMT